MPSPAKTSFSSTLKLPPSKLSGVVFFSQMARKGRPDPDVRLHSETLSATISVCAMGTSADWVFFSVTRSFNLYSNKSPRSRPEASAPIISRAASKVEGGGGGDAAGPDRPPALPLPAPLLTRMRLMYVGDGMLDVSADSVFRVVVLPLTSIVSAAVPT